MSNNNVTTGGILVAIILGIGIAKWLFAETITTRERALREGAPWWSRARNVRLASTQI